MSEAPNPQPAAAVPLPYSTVPNRVIVLVVAGLGGFLVTFMSSAINVALPLIQTDYHMSAVSLSWLSTSYMLVSAAFLLPSGRVADIYGRVRVFSWGMLMFSVIAFASAFAPSASVLLALRAVHGIGLAIGSATSMALVTLAYPPELRGRALGMTVAAIYAGLTLGPVLGGLLIHNFGWRSLFLVVGAAAMVNFALAMWKLRGFDWLEPKGGRFDYAGSVIYALALTALLLGFTLLPGYIGAILIAVGLVGVGGFLWWETRADDPLFHVELLRRSRVFAFSNLATFVNYMAMAAVIFLLSLYLEYNRGLNAETTGFVLVGGTFVQAISAPLAGRLADRMDARKVASGGMVFCVLGLLGMAFIGPATAYWYVIAMLCVIGLGMGFFSTPNTHAIMGSVDARLVGVTSATLAMMRQAGQSISMGIATLVMVIEVGRKAIQPADYPHLLTSMRICFVIFTVLCVFGVAAQLVGPRKTPGIETEAATAGAKQE